MSRKVRSTSVLLPRVPAGGPDEEWFEKASAAVERDRTLEARGLNNKVVMMAWDLGYELTAGNDPHHYKVEYEKLLLLADHLGLGAKARSEWGDGRDAGQENSAKTAKISSSDRHALIRLAASLPAGDDTRRAILSGLKQVAADDKVKVENEDGKVVYVSPETLKGPDKSKYKPVKEEKGSPGMTHEEMNKAVNTARSDFSNSIGRAAFRESSVKKFFDQSFGDSDVKVWKSGDTIKAELVTGEKTFGRAGLPGGVKINISLGKSSDGKAKLLNFSLYPGEEDKLLKAASTHTGSLVEDMRYYRHIMPTAFDDLSAMLLKRDPGLTWDLLVRAIQAEDLDQEDLRRLEKQYSSGALSLENLLKKIAPRGLKTASSHDLKQLQKWVAFGTPKFSKGDITRWLREMGCEEVQLYGPWNTRGNPYLEGTYAYNGKTYDVTFEKGAAGAHPVYLNIHRDSDY